MQVAAKRQTGHESPFGELLRVEGPYAAANPFRFSSKFTDDETGLVCYGLRYYNPALGRFINRDPIGEAGGPNLYAFCGNNGVNRWDFLGLADPTVGVPEGGGSSGTWDNIINLGGFDEGWGSYGNSRGTSLVDGSKHDSQNKDFPSIRRWLESRVTGGKTYADRENRSNGPSTAVDLLNRIGDAFDPRMIAATGYYFFHSRPIAQGQ